MTRFSVRNGHTMVSLSILGVLASSRKNVTMLPDVQPLPGENGRVAGQRDELLTYYRTIGGDTSAVRIFEEV